MKVFLKPFSFLSLVSLSAIIGLFTFLYSGNNHTLLTIIKFFVYQWIQLFVISLCFSLIDLVIINSFGIVSSIKGKQKLTVITSFCQISRYAVLTLLLIQLTPSLTAIINSAQILMRVNSTYEEISNIYYFNEYKESAYHSSLGYNNAVSLRNDFVASNQLFTFSKSLFIYPDYSNIDTATNYYAVDESYLSQTNLLPNEFDSEAIYIFMDNTVNYQIDTSYIIDYFAMYGIDSSLLHFIDYDSSLMTFNVNDLLYQDKIADYPLIYTPTLTTANGEVYGDLFFYNGNLQDARKYAYNIFYQHGYLPGYRVNSLGSTYLNTVNNVISGYTDQIIEFVTLLITYIIISALLFISDYHNHKQLYFLSHVEGRKPYHTATYILYFVFPLILSLLTSILITNSLIKNNTTSIFLIVLLIITDYLIYTFICRKARL